MKTAIDTQSIEALWQRYKTPAPSGGDEITFEGLRNVLQALGHRPTDEELHHLLVGAESSGSITFDKFTALVASLQGDLESRLKIAFDVFDENGDDLITPDEMRNILGRFDVTETDLAQIFGEADRDGGGALDFEEFCGLMPEAHERAVNHYRDSHILFASALPREAASAPVDRAEPPVSRPPAAVRERRSAGPPHGEHDRGTSRLQMQISLFRLLQGAAYRCFRENCSANYETHLRAKKLPYTIPHFVAFMNKAVALYKALGVVEPACFPVLDAVTESLNAEYLRLQERIRNWGTTEKTPEMMQTAEAMQRHRAEAATVREKFAAGVELALTVRKTDAGQAGPSDGALALHERSRLRRLELHREIAPPVAHDGADPKDYLAAWNRVLLESADEEIDGAMMPAAYWYEDFMPKLLAAFSVGTAGDLAANTDPDEAALDAWFAAARDAGEFARYGADVDDHFADCGPRQKLAVRQAWRLTRHYLNGVQKRRERQEFGRDSGLLSQYVAFLDVYLGRSDVRQAAMRVSFPYYIGPAVWRFFHTAAEIVCSRPAGEQASLTQLFKDFFKLFATMHPCPYCRYHLNDYVVQNREVDMYPLEYLILGRNPAHDDFRVSIDDKLAAVTDGQSLRLFLWKLHNTVSSSIARTEPWFHREDNAFYTSRYWPSLDSELARSRALNHDSISIDRLSRIYGLLKPAARLAALRMKLQSMHRRGEVSEFAAVCDDAHAVVADLESAFAAGAFLEQTYRFDPDLVDDAPHFTPEEEDFGRSGVFVED